MALSRTETVGPDPGDGPDDGHNPPAIFIVVVDDGGTERMVEFTVDESQGAGFEPLPDDYQLPAEWRDDDDDGAATQPPRP